MTTNVDGSGGGGGGGGSDETKMRSSGWIKTG